MTTPSQAIVISKVVLNDLDWLIPSADLEAFSGKEFGRDVEGKIAQISTSHRAYKINLRRRPAVVVIAVDEYEKLLSFKTLVSQMIEQRTSEAVMGATAEYDQLMARIRHPNTRAAGDALFSPEGVDLAASFKPGSTETG
jgi:PHD/YefM family antitoxin component YafN of YafNO toxin-antitoxin module